MRHLPPGGERLVGPGRGGGAGEPARVAGSLELPHLTAILVDNASSTRPLGDIGAKFAAFGWSARTGAGRGPQGPSGTPTRVWRSSSPTSAMATSSGPPPRTRSA